MYGSFDQIPVKTFKSTIDPISDSFPKTVPVEILCKGIYKSKGCVQSLRECITNQFPIRSFNKAIQKSGNAFCNLVTGILDFTPRNTFQCFVELITDHGAKFCKIAGLPGIFDQFCKIFETALDSRCLEHIINTTKR